VILRHAYNAFLEANALNRLEHRDKLIAPRMQLQHLQHSTAQHSTAQHSTAQHSTAQHSTAQHSTAQHEQFLTARDKGMDKMHEMAWIMW